MNSVFIPLDYRPFKEIYEWAKEQFGIPYNMLESQCGTSAIWNIKRETNGHRFIFERQIDLTKFKQHFDIK